jgi:hypothetical protein
MVGPDEYAAVAADPKAAKYLMRFVGARELLHDIPRWCLWLEGASATEINSSPVLRERVADVRSFREASRKAATQRKAATPHLFDERRHPSSDYLAIPAHVGEHRRYFTAARFGSDVICGNANFLAADPDGFLLGILSSSMFIAWMKAIGGRIKSDLRFSSTFTYNSFPLPELTVRQRDDIVSAAAGIVAARTAHAGLSLAKLYDPGSMPADLLAAHEELDRAADTLFGRGDFTTNSGRQRALFRAYSNLTGQSAQTIVEQVGEFAFGDRL